MPLKLITGGGGSVILDANTTASNYTMYVPAENGTLVTTSSAILGNATALSSGTVPTARLPTIPKANMPSGSILQVIQTIKTDTFTSSAAETWTDISGLSASITPSSTSSRIFVHVFMGRVSGTNTVAFRVLRNGGLYNAGDAAGSRPQLHSAEANQGRDANHTGQSIIGYVDSPASTSSVTYQVQVRPEGSYFGLNRSQNDSDGNNSYNGRSSSTVVLMEIAG